MLGYTSAAISKLSWWFQAYSDMNKPLNLKPIVYCAFRNFRRHPVLATQGTACNIVWRHHTCMACRPCTIMGMCSDLGSVLTIFPLANAPAICNPGVSAGFLLIDVSTKTH